MTFKEFFQKKYPDLTGRDGWANAHDEMTLVYIRIFDTIGDYIDYKLKGDQS